MNTFNKTIVEIDIVVLKNNTHTLYTLHMDTRINNIRTKFSKSLEDFHKSTGNFQNGNTLNTPKETKVLKEPHIGQTPLMMKKINRYKVELGKNNMKKVQKPFTFHGNIDDYLTEIKEVN